MGPVPVQAGMLFVVSLEVFITIQPFSAAIATRRHSTASQIVKAMQTRRQGALQGRLCIV